MPPLPQTHGHSMYYMVVPELQVWEVALECVHPFMPDRRYGAVLMRAQPLQVCGGRMLQPGTLQIRVHSRCSAQGRQSGCLQTLAVIDNIGLIQRA